MLHSSNKFPGQDNIPETMQPKTLRAIMRAHVQTREKHPATAPHTIKMPRVTLLLTYGYILRGYFEDFDFGNARVSFRVEDGGRMDIAYLNYDDIAAVTLHDLDDCPEFLAELKTLD